MTLIDNHSRINKDAAVETPGSNICFLPTIWSCIFSAGRSFFATKLQLKQTIKRPSYCVSPETQGSVGYTAVEWQYTATVR